MSRYFDRITRPEQLLTALPRAMPVLTDPAECGPVTLALCQDAQAEAFDWPETLLRAAASGSRAGRRPMRRNWPTPCAALRAARAPLIIAGGGVLYAEAAAALAASPTRMAFRSPKPRPARAPCRTIIRSTSAPSA